MRIIKAIKISLKNTLPVYLMISTATSLFLLTGGMFIEFLKENTILAKISFTIIYNLLYLIPQTLGILISLFIIKKSRKWFFRTAPSISIVSTFAMILLFIILNFFPKDLNNKLLLINFLIIIMMNTIFSTIYSINIYSKARKHLDMN